MGNPDNVKRPGQTRNDQIQFQGYRILLNCAVCFEQILSPEEAGALYSGIIKQNYTSVERILALHECGLFVLQPSSNEVKMLCDCRIVISPIHWCHKEIDLAELERHVLLSQRFARKESI